MKIETHDHIAVNTADIKKSEEFYKDFFGFRKLRTVENGDSTLTYMENDAGITIELFDWHGGCSYHELTDDMAGIAHIAFKVDDIEEWYGFLKEKGADIKLPLSRLDHLGMYVVLVRDPGGAVVELCRNID